MSCGQMVVPNSHQKTAYLLKRWCISHNISPCYPQSNGKAKATVKSIKKLISAAWTGHSVNWTKLSCSLLQIAILHAEKIVFPRYKSCLDILFKILPQLIQTRMAQAHHRSTSSAQNLIFGLWDIYRVITAVGPHRKYFVKTHNGNVLVRNRRFLHKCNIV